MAYEIISEKCVSCGACKNDCPMEAIRDGSPYRIDPALCIDCGACLDACPEGAVRAG